MNNLAMKNTMNTPMERTPGGLLGIDHEIESQARFVYDRRGPRVSPAIEIQHWMKKFNEVYTEQCKKFDPDHKTKMSRLDWGSIDWARPAEGHAKPSWAGRDDVPKVANIRDMDFGKRF